MQTFFPQPLPSGRPSLPLAGCRSGDLLRARQRPIVALAGSSGGTFEHHREEHDDIEAWWRAAPGSPDDLPLQDPPRSEVVPLGATYRTWGMPPGARRAPSGPFANSLQEWRSFRARLVALEQTDNLFLGCDACSKDLPWTLPDPCPPFPLPTLPPPSSSSPRSSITSSSASPPRGAPAASRPSPPPVASSSSSPVGFQTPPCLNKHAGKGQKPAPKGSDDRSGSVSSSAECSTSFVSDAKQQSSDARAHQHRQGKSSPRHSKQQSQPQPQPAQHHHQHKQPPKTKQGPVGVPGRRASTSLVLSAGPASWAHLLSHPEPGCLLLAQGGPETSGMAFFDRAVILLTSHSESKGSVGFVLNKPSPMKVAELQLASACPGFMESFGAQRLQIGGPLHMDHATVLHRFMGLAGGNEVADKLYTGGLTDAVRLVQAGLAAPQDFNLMLGVSGWAPRQLASEIAAGMWHCVSASPDLVLPRKSAASSAAAADSLALAREGQDMWARILAIATGPKAMPHPRL